MRDVQRYSRQLAEETKNEDYYLSLAHLSGIENANFVPTHNSLAAIAAQGYAFHPLTGKSLTVEELSAIASEDFNPYGIFGKFADVHLMEIPQDDLIMRVRLASALRESLLLRWPEHKATERYQKASELTDSSPHLLPLTISVIVRASEDLIIDERILKAIAPLIFKITSWLPGPIEGIPVPELDQSRTYRGNPAGLLSDLRLPNGAQDSQLHR